ncbi:hypothetical protein [Bradyrhizobium sp. Leo170]|uniref:hypothetical protein n=1 Tax=Bradyrhizobium sp. Leo170 TaxID=1571199 RepID=UPI0013EEB77A|nr:hypothetical protein [Bradyrhizobium sp. Leo170]
MSESKVEIHVQLKRPRRFVLLLIQACFWTMLIGSIAVSRVWLGGSFLVEILATIFSIAMLAKFALQFAGKEVEMSTDDVAAWLRDGARRTSRNGWLPAPPRSSPCRRFANERARLRPDF